MTAGSEHDRLALLASVNEVTDGRVLLGETVARLLEFVVPAFADVATLDTISPRGELTRIGSRVQGPGREELERGLLHRRPVASAPVGLPRALSSGQGQLIERMAEEHLRAIAADEADYELLRALELRSMVDVPLLARGRIVGALACGVGPSGREYGPEDLRFAEVLSARLALALDNAGLSAAVSGLEQRLEATLTNLAEAVLVRDPAGPLVFANQAAAGLLGLDSVEDVVAASAEQLMELFNVFDERGRKLSLEELPSARAARGMPAQPLLVRNVIRSTGEERWLLHKATPVLDAEGALSMVVSVIEDLTEVKRAELAQRLLAEAGQALSSSLDYEQTLQQVAELTVPGLADWCAVAMRGDERLELVAAAHVDPKQAELGRAVGRDIAAYLGERAATAAVIAHRRARVIAELDDALLSRAGLRGELLKRVNELGLGSLILMPLAAPGQAAIGVLVLAMAQSGRRFDQSDVRLVRELGHRVAIAVENARLYSERSQIATTLQRSLLPPELPDIPGFRLAGSYHAAGEHNDVGGDFYDAFEVPGGWMVVVGDVAGRGAEAAALTSLSRYTLRTAGRLLGDPLAAFQELNAALRERESLSLVSVCCVLLRSEEGDGARADVILAGHPPAFHVRGGTPTPVGVFAPFLGAYELGGWQAMSTELAVADQLVLYTDGVIDTVGEQERFGEERLVATLAEGGEEASAANTVARIERAVKRFALGPQVDDMAIIVVERTGRG
ncbi:MAG: SpoIIE family protein phosphatase [Solirubrobacterales bacterium]|nr:SpoIIE family protein phosphatase [Solirubrobacterales bacterium]